MRASWLPRKLRGRGGLPSCVFNRARAAGDCVTSSRSTLLQLVTYNQEPPKWQEREARQLLSLSLIFEILFA